MFGEIARQFYTGYTKTGKQGSLSYSFVSIAKLSSLQAEPDLELLWGAARAQTQSGESSLFKFIIFTGGKQKLLRCHIKTNQPTNTSPSTTNQQKTKKKPQPTQT